MTDDDDALIKPTYDSGTCGFCGGGGGHLGETGDESSQTLHSVVRSGEPGKYEYYFHPHAWTADKQYITWCGHCVGGLVHKYQRYDDINLKAKLTAYKLWQEMDGCRFALWGLEDSEARNAAMDDPAIHIAKLHRDDEINDMQMEVFRRAGYDLAKREGWRE